MTNTQLIQLDAYVAVAKKQNKTTEPKKWLELEMALLAMDRATNFRLGKTVRQYYPSL